MWWELYCVLCLVSGWLHGSAVHPVCHNIRRHGSHKEQPHGNISPVSSSLQQFEFCDVVLYIWSQRCSLCPKSAWIPFPLTFPSFFPFSFLFPSFSSISCPCLLCHKGVHLTSATESWKCRELLQHGLEHVLSWSSVWCILDMIQHGMETV